MGRRGPVKYKGAPSWALSLMWVGSRPLAVCGIRNETSGASGDELNEYDRFCPPVSGTTRLTYCPGRKVSGGSGSSCMEKLVVVSERWLIALIWPLWLATPVLQTLEVAAIRMTQSEFGRIWQART